MAKPDVIVDTCVLLDICLKQRPRHTEAGKLIPLLKKRAVYLPMHGMFELSSAIQSEGRRRGNLDFNLTLTEEDPLTLKTITIDQKFLATYLTDDAPRLAGGDMIFVAVAKVDNLELITEDNKMYKEAQRLGVKVYRTKEYLNTHSGS